MIDEREIWYRPALASARARGYEARRIHYGEEVWEEGEGVGFIRPHADPATLVRNHGDYAMMRAAGLTMIQDPMQMALYEDKWGQAELWGDLMPETHLLKDKAAALALVDAVQYPIVSKAKEGASSVNVRIIPDAPSLVDHIEQVWGAGVSVNPCGGSTRVKQRGYMILQRFIAHDVTWRVNIVGNAFAIFRRFNYPDRPVAQTGNVAPVMKVDAEMESLLAFSKQFFELAETNWCAIDVLKDADGDWKLLETSLAWPWPSPGDCDDAPFFGTPHQWRGMWDCMFDAVEAGVWRH